MKAGRKESAFRRIMTMKRKAAKVVESTAKLPLLNGEGFFCRRLPAITRAPAIGRNLPQSMTTAVVRFQKTVLLPRPLNSEPLPAMEDTNSYRKVVKP